MSALCRQLDYLAGSGPFYAERLRVTSGTTAVAATKSMLNERFGPLLDEAMERETHHARRLFDGQDAQAALRAFAERRRA